MVVCAVAREWVSERNSHITGKILEILGRTQRRFLAACRLDLGDVAIFRAMCARSARNYLGISMRELGIFVDHLGKCFFYLG